MGLNSYNKFIVSEYENIKYRKNRDNRITQKMEIT